MLDTLRRIAARTGLVHDPAREPLGTCARCRRHPR